jgi:uncharacterized membrane protein
MNRTEPSNEALNFFSGIMVGGILAGLVISTFIEAVTEEWNKIYNTNFHVLVGVFWALMFIFSSIAFWQIVKLFMKRLYQTPRKELWYFDFATLACIIIGIGLSIYFVA